jgi:hypothetical protein
VHGDYSACDMKIVKLINTIKKFVLKGLELAAFHGSLDYCEWFPSSKIGSKPRRNSSVIGTVWLYMAV